MAGDGKLPTAAVLAAASAMVSVGLVAFFASRPADAPAADPPAVRAAMDRTTPERAAESFLDAWRKRDHEAALALSRGEANDAARTRAQADAALGDEERELKRQLWDAMAATRLALVVKESETLEGGRVAVRGVADGKFLGKEYRRQVDFVVAPAASGTDGDWVVERMGLGPILSDMPDILSLPPPRQREPGPSLPSHEPP
jgi:hypothetical protein